MRRVDLLFIIVAVLLIISPVAAQYDLGVIKGEAKKIPIVVIDLYIESGVPGLRALALEVLEADLPRS
jgi:hypothetical protein